MINYLGKILFVTLIFLSSSSSTLAAKDWKSLAPNSLYADFWTSAENDIQSAAFTLTSTAGIYKKADDATFQSYSGVQVTGVTTNTSQIDQADSDVTALTESGTSKKVQTVEINVKEVGENLYIKFPNAPKKQLNKNWVVVPEKEYKDFGIQLGLEDLFDVARIETNDVSKELYEKSTSLARKHNLYSLIQADLEDDYDVPNATRYDLVLRQSAIVAYYKDLDKQLSAEAKEQTVLNIDGFMKRLDDKKFVTYLADHSYVSLWIDNANNLPVQYVEASSLPPAVGNKTGYIYFVTSISWSDVNKPVVIKKPTNTIALNDAKVLLGIDSLVQVKAEIKALLKEASKTKDSSEKSELYFQIAQLYSEFDQKASAVNFKKAASYIPKNSPTYFHVLADAELVTNNGKAAIALYEKGLLQNPSDDLLSYYYGSFLLGISHPSAPYQNLNRALIINKSLVDNVVDDINLLNLYINYIMLNKPIEAEALVSKFDDFKNGLNYNQIARAYHRVGNEKSSLKYIKLAEKAGYTQSQNDKQFFAEKF